MQQPLVSVIISTRSDFNVMRRGLETLRVMGVPYVFDVVSTFRTPDQLMEFINEKVASGVLVFIVGCGSAAVMASQIATATTLPVIGVPLDASPLRGQDSLLSMVMTPSGIPIATMGINNSESAAVLATQILALRHPQYREVLAHRRTAGTQRSESILKELTSEYPDLCRPERTAPATSVSSESDTDGGVGSEAITPDPPGRIRPGMVAAGPSASSLVATPAPHEPVSTAGTPRPTAPADPDPTTPAPVMAGRLVAAGSMADDETAPLPPAPPRFATRREPSAPPTAFMQAVSSPEISRPSALLHTKVFKVDPANVNEDVIDHAMMVLLEGGVIAFPTDTVYGLAADATNRAAVEALCQVKGREHQRTLGLLLPDADMLGQVVREVPGALESVIAKCWPGALTIILAKQPGMLTGVTRSDRIGIRVPSDPISHAILSRVGRPLVMRNAALDAHHPMTSADPVIRYYTGHVDCIIDGGMCNTATGASTVLNAVNEPFEILREGPVTRATLAGLLGNRLKE